MATVTPAPLLDLILITVSSDVISTKESEHYNEVLSTVTLSMVTTDSVTDDLIKESGSIPLVTIVAVLAGVIVLLVLLMIGCCVTSSGVVIYRRHKKNSLTTRENHYDMPLQLPSHRNRNSFPTLTNRSYSSHLHLQLPDPPSSIYSQIKDEKEMGKHDLCGDTNSGMYDDICENHYALISEHHFEKSVADANSQEKNPPSSELVCNGAKQQGNEDVDGGRPNYENESILLTQRVATFKVDSHIDEIEQTEAVIDDYTDMTGSRDVSLSPTSSKYPSRNSSPRPALLSKSFCHTMENNPTYNSSWSLIGGFHEEDIYTDPDASTHSESKINVTYETVYSESVVQPSIFKQNVTDQDKSRPNSDTMVEEHAQAEEVDNEVIAYSPIYLVNDAQPHKRNLLVVTNTNIRGVKVLGTGFFGKVVLADTVGLSLKDLNMSDNDDDKSVSVRVAVKKLKLNASKTTQEAFEKECKFMARLNHPNVIRLLGVCRSEQSQFIMMEYMERGDLNEYLNKFEKVIGEGVPQEKEVLVGTLVYMCSQIASAMNYLVSRNFIHRDLAARNCLVGADNLIKLADFGMSRSLYESHYYIVRGQAVLPVRWMATECFYGKFSAKTDVWAFGVTMWEVFMLAKERPYSEMEDMELVNDAIESECRILLQQPRHCPDDVYEVMLKCWAKNPKDRATFGKLYTMLTPSS